MALTFLILLYPFIISEEPITPRNQYIPHVLKSSPKPFSANSTRRARSLITSLICASIILDGIDCVFI